MHLDGIIHPLKKHGLVSHRDTRICKPAQGITHLGGQLPGVVGMNGNEEGMILAEHLAQLGRDSLRQKYGNACADADKLNVGNGVQAGQNTLEAIVREEQRVTP